MKRVLSATFRLHKGALRPLLYGLFALAWIGASTATAQSGGALVQRLDSIAGTAVRENRAVGIVAAVVKGNDTLLLKAYGKAVVDNDSPATVDTVFQIGSDSKQFTAAAILQLRGLLSDSGETDDNIKAVKIGS
jgi:CubicO group peptidase (beta-lactamase class C family)